MAKTKKLLSVFLALLMMLTVFPASMIANAANATTVTVESVNAVPGSNVEVNINVKNNPGILAANFTVTYDKGLTLIDSKSGDAFSALSMTKPENYNSPCKFGWDALEIADEDIKDGTILTLTFSVDKGVSANSKLNVKLSYQNGNIIDSDLNDIPVTINNGSVTIIDYIPGDINGDGTIDLKDVTLVRRLVTGYSVTANKLAADVNGDGEITMKDVVLIRRYVVDAEGYGVTLVPGGSNVHTHTMTATAAKAATCTENGNIAYWYCSSCKKYFTDKDGNNVVSQADTVIKAKGHTIVIDAAVDPTYEKTGLTEGSHCSTCKTVLKKQEVIPKLQKTEYSITYHISNGDEYLAQQTIQNDNPATYTSEQGVSKFANPSVQGYQFLGWYDLPSGDAAENIKSIPAGTTGNIDLYARWEKLTYKVIKGDLDEYKAPAGEAKFISFASGLINSGKLKDYEYMQEFRNRDSRLYASILFPFKGWYETNYGTNFIYEWIKNGNNKSKTGFNFRKMSPLENDANNDGQATGDYPCIRYAEVLLIFAEAHTQTTGFDGQTQAALNQLRDRCGMPNVPTSLGKEDGLALIKNERRIELAGEGLRSDDLSRYGDAYWSAQMNNVPISTPDGEKVITMKWDSRMSLRPIPQTAIDLNPLLATDQNPGY